MDFNDTLLGREAMELEDTARWRSEKAAEYPDDSRNADAETLLLKLADQLRGITGSAKSTSFELFHDDLFCDDNEDEDKINSSNEVVRLWSEYRSRVGFRNFPESAEEYLDDLMELARAPV